LQFFLQRSMRYRVGRAACYRGTGTLLRVCAAVASEKGMHAILSATR